MLGRNQRFGTADEDLFLTELCEVLGVAQPDCANRAIVIAKIGTS